MSSIYAMSDAKKSRILAAALPVFMRHGFRRVSMADIAEAAGMSRPALYLTFCSKEDIFTDLLKQWIDETIENVRTEMSRCRTPKSKLTRAFEVWAVQPFATAMESREMRELLECSFDFAEDVMAQGYRQFEAAIASVLPNNIRGRPTAERTAHVLASAVRGFKKTATTQAELRQLIEELLLLSLPAA